MGQETDSGYNTSLLAMVYPELGKRMVDAFETLATPRRHRVDPIALDQDNWESQIGNAHSTLGLSEGENPNDPEKPFVLKRMGDIIDMLRRSISPESTRVERPYFFNESVIGTLGIDRTVPYTDPRVAREVFLYSRITAGYIDEVLRKALDRMLRLKDEEGDLQGGGVFIYGSASEEVIELAEYGKIPANFALVWLVNELERINKIPFFKIKEYRNREMNVAGSNFNLLLEQTENFTFLAVLRAWQILDPLPMKGD